MKVSELIEELQRVDQEIEVTITTDYGPQHIVRVANCGYNGPITIVTY